MGRSKFLFKIIYKLQLRFLLFLNDSSGYSLKVAVMTTRKNYTDILKSHQYYYLGKVSKFESVSHCRDIYHKRSRVLFFW